MSISSRSCEHCEAWAQSVFCSLSKEGLEWLDGHKRLLHFKKGQYVFHEGTRLEGLYCVNRGLIKLENSSASGNTHTLRMVSQGGVLGYRALFASENCQASALVQEEAEICLISREALLILMEKYPEIALIFLQRISRELREAEQRLCGLTDKSAAQRVAEALLFFKDHFPERAWTRKELAEWAGTTPETVMRTLADFEERAWIAQQGRRVDIRDKSALLELADIAL